jgi:hypothetical protein
MQNYTVTMDDGTAMTVKGVGSVKQVFGFLEFRSPKAHLGYQESGYPHMGEILIVSIRAEQIMFYAPETVAQAPVVETGFSKSVRATRR